MLLLSAQWKKKKLPFLLYERTACLIAWNPASPTRHLHQKDTSKLCLEHFKPPLEGGLQRIKIQIHSNAHSVLGLPALGAKQSAN